MPLTPEEIAAREEAERVKREEARLAKGNEAIKLTRRTMKKIVKAVELFKWDYNRYPANLEELDQRPADVAPEIWRGTYYRGPLQDSWGNDLIYREPGEGENPYDLISLGEDGKKGGEEFGADLSNHD